MYEYNEQLERKKLLSGHLIENFNSFDTSRIIKLQLINYIIK